MKKVGKIVGNIVNPRRDAGRLKSSPAHCFPYICLLSSLAQKVTQTLPITRSYITRLSKTIQGYPSSRSVNFSQIVGKLLADFFCQQTRHLIALDSLGLPWIVLDGFGALILGRRL